MKPDEEFVEVVGRWLEGWLQRSMMTFFLCSKDHDLSPAQLATLIRIEHQGHSGVSNLGGDFGVTSAAASQMLERLVQNGYIERHEDPEDRRAKKIVLTDRGRTVVLDLMARRREWYRRLGGKLSDAQKKHLVVTFRDLISRTAEFDNSETPRQEQKEKVSS
jgi:DNA-binding MarR family transcriptional regulator